MYRTRARIGACRHLRQQSRRRVLRQYKQKLDLPKTARLYKDTAASSPQVGFFYHGCTTRLWWRPRRRTPWPIRLWTLGQSGDQCFRAGGQMPGPFHRLCLRHGAGAFDRAPDGMVKVFRAGSILRIRETEKFRGDASRGEFERSERVHCPAKERIESGMSERLLFLTGHLAYPRLERLMRSMGETSFSWRYAISE